MKRARAPVRLSYLVDPVLSGAPSTTPLDEHGWRRLVGVDIARRTRPLRVDRGVLLVAVSSSSWAQELALMETALVARSREAGLDVSRVRFKVQPIARPTREPERQVTVPRTPPAEPLPAVVDLALSKVDDPELRAILQLAAQRNLAWQRAHDRLSAAPPASPGLPRAAAGTARSVTAGSTPSSWLRDTLAAGRGSRRSRGGR